MAQLPDAAALGELPSPQPATGIGQIEPSNVRLLGLQGSFLERAGSDWESAGESIRQADVHYNTLYAQDAATKLQAAAIGLQHDPQTGFQAAKGQNALGTDFASDYRQRFRDQVDHLASGLQNDQQRQLFQARANIMANQYDASLLSHQTQQQEVFANATDENGLKTGLNEIAISPYDPIVLNTNIAHAEGILAAREQRTGQPQMAAIQQYKQTAYATQVHALMNSNAYAAEKALEDHQADLGVQGVQLQKEVQKEVQQVQGRDFAHGLIFGNAQPRSPSDIQPGTQGAPPLAGIVTQLESGDQRYTQGGRLTVSPKGAQGEWQVMPPTARDPGYGVTPAQNNSPEELARVGKDYLGAMTARYQDPALTLAAYNAGPARVDDWISRFGDPRTGGITSANWAAKIPFAETKNYVQKGLAMVEPQQPGALYGTPTAKELSTQLPALVQKARDWAQQAYPGDTVFEDAVASRVLAYGSTVTAAWNKQQEAAKDTLVRGMLGSQPDGSDKPMSIDALLAPPEMKEAWRNATPETQQAIQDHFTHQQKLLTPDAANLYYNRLGEATGQPEQFVRRNLMADFNQMPEQQWLQLVGMQKSIGTKEYNAQMKDTAVLDAQKIAETQVLRFSDIRKPAEGAPASAWVPYNTYMGRLTEQVQGFVEQNKKPPSHDEMLTMAKNLTGSVDVPGKIWGSNTIHMFQLTPEQESQAKMALTPKMTQQLTTGFQARYGRAPQPGELQQAAIAQTLHPYDQQYLMGLDAIFRGGKAAAAQTAAGKVTR